MRPYGAYTIRCMAPCGFRTSRAVVAADFPAFGGESSPLRLRHGILLLSYPGFRRRARMCPGFDPEIWRNLRTFREMVSRRYQTPTKEWPLLYVEEHAALLVVREWPDGSVTAYHAEPRASAGS